MTYEIITFTGNKHTIKPRLELYSQEAFSKDDMPGLAIELDDVTEGENNPIPFCSLTVSFGEWIGVKNCAYIDTNNTDFADQLLKQGIAKDTGFYKESGFCTYPLWVFDENFLKEIGAENYEKYSQAYDEYMHSIYGGNDEIVDDDEDEGMSQSM